MYCGSVGVFISGVRSFNSSPRWAADSTKTGITNETSMINIRNTTTYNGVTNRGLIRLNSVSIGTSSASNGTLRFKINATIGGSPVWNTINGSTADSGVTITSGNSLTSIDTTGETSITGGIYIFNLSIGSNGSQIIDLTPYDIFIAPSEIMTISLYSATNTNASLSVNWSEDV